MKVKTSVAAKLHSPIAHEEREKQNARDLEIINRRARRLNKEAEDVLAYQGVDHEPELTRSFRRRAPASA